MNNIFLTECQKYYDSKYIVIPLDEGSKKPVTQFTGYKGWDFEYLKKIATKTLYKKDNNNIAVLLDNKNIIAIDVDIMPEEVWFYEDDGNPIVGNDIYRHIKPTPIIKQSKRGFTYFYFKDYTLADCQKENLPRCDILSSGLCTLPPSILEYKNKMTNEIINFEFKWVNGLTFLDQDHLPIITKKEIDKFRDTVFSLFERIKDNEEIKSYYKSTTGQYCSKKVYSDESREQTLRKLTTALIINEYTDNEIAIKIIERDKLFKSSWFTNDETNFKYNFKSDESVFKYLIITWIPKFRAFLIEKNIIKM